MIKPPYIDKLFLFVETLPIERRLDVYYEAIDKLLLIGAFEAVDYMCKRISVLIEQDKISIQSLIGILTITLPAKNKLKNRRLLTDLFYGLI